MVILYLTFISYKNLRRNLNSSYICSVKFKQHLKKQ